MKPWCWAEAPLGTTQPAGLEDCCSAAPSRPPPPSPPHSPVALHGLGRKGGDHAELLAQAVQQPAGNHDLSGGQGSREAGVGWEVCGVWGGIGAERCAAKHTGRQTQAVQLSNPHANTQCYWFGGPQPQTQSQAAHLVAGLQGAGGPNLELPLAGHHLGVDAGDDEAGLPRGWGARGWIMGRC